MYVYTYGFVRVLTYRVLFAEETLFRLQVFGAASVLLLLATSVYQVYYLRSFFVSKKVL
jgi:hypothetical protein